MKPVREMSFREQIGAAAKYGAYSNSFLTHGFRALSSDGDSLVMTPEALETWVDHISTREIGSEIWPLVRAQPDAHALLEWTDLDLLKLRGYLMLRLGRARTLSETDKNLALTRTYLHENKGLAEKGLYRDGSAGQRLSRTERSNLLSDIARHIESELVMTSLDDSTEAPFRAARKQSLNEIEDVLIESAYDLYTYPAAKTGRLQISKSVSIRALRDGITEYRYTVHANSRGRGKPELELLGGPGAHFERLMKTSRDGVVGYDYQVVIPFSTPMMISDAPRHFSWIIKSRVSEKFFDHDGRNRVVGFRPSRDLRSARVALQFASGTAPEHVAVVTNARTENMDDYSSATEMLPVVDDYVEKTWENPRVAHYCNLVWHR